MELGSETTLGNDSTRFLRMLKSNVESEVDSMVKKLSALELGTEEGTGEAVSAFFSLSFLLPLLRLESLVDTPSFSQLSQFMLCFLLPFLLGLRVTGVV